MIIKNKNFIIPALTSKIYKGSILVYRTITEMIKSCFGSGVWRSDKPWLGNETWKNN